MTLTSVSASPEDASAQAATQRRDDSESLTRQTETLRAVLDATNEAMLVFSPEGALLDINRRTTDLFGATTTSYLGRSYTELAPLIERIFADPVAVMARWADCLLYTSPSPRDRTRSRMPSSA